MFKRCVALYLLFFLAAPPVHAYDPIAFPPWHMTGNEACYGFEDAKKLKFTETSCLQYEDYYKTTAPLLLQLQSTVADQNKHIEALDASSKELRATLTQVQTDRDEAARRAVLAESHSVFGGGFWLVLVTAGLFFAGGLFVGYKMMK